MNKVFLIGRITKDLELRNTKSGSNVCEFTIAVNRARSKEDQAYFINCMVWNNQAENLCKYQGKGSLISVLGELRNDSYEVNGEKKYKNYVLVDNIEFLQNKTSEKEEPKKEVNPFAEFGEKIEKQEQFDYSESNLPW